MNASDYVGWFASFNAKEIPVNRWCYIVEALIGRIWVIQVVTDLKRYPVPDNSRKPRNFLSGDAGTEHTPH